MNNRRCPWCGKEATALTDEKGTSIACCNQTCLVQPSGEIHETPEKAWHSWNNPTTIKERYYSESQLKEILENLFADDFIMDYFFGKK